MKRWYAFYNERVTIRQKPADEIVQQVVEELKMPEVFGQISGNIRKLLNTRLKMTNQGVSCPEIIVVDALEKKSASKLR